MAVVPLTPLLATPCADCAVHVRLVLSCAAAVRVCITFPLLSPYVPRTGVMCMSSPYTMPHGHLYPYAVVHSTYTQYPSRIMRIAIIGSGIAGLTASYLLTQHAHAQTIVIYERAAHLGMDAHGYELDIDVVNGKKQQTHDTDKKTAATQQQTHDTDKKVKKTIRVDVPLRVFTESYYRYVHIDARMM